MVEMKIEIVTKPYIKRYLQRKFGENVAITRESEIGKFLFNYLGRAVKDDQGSKLTDYKEKLTITLTESIYVRYGYVISRTGVKEFNQFVEDLVKRDMRISVSSMITGAKMTNRKLMVSEALRAFAEAHGYDENVFPYETMKKDYDRWKHRNQQRNYENKRKKKS